MAQRAWNVAWYVATSAAVLACAAGEEGPGTGSTAGSGQGAAGTDAGTTGAGAIGRRPPGILGEFGGMGGEGAAGTSSAAGTGGQLAGGSGGEGGAGLGAGAGGAGGAGGAWGPTGAGGAGGATPLCVVDADCDDGLHCNGTEACLSGACSPGTPPCDDGVACTVDACDEVADACLHEAKNTLCDDGVFCNGVEACVPFAGCVAGAPPACDDGLDCTADHCDALTDVCAHIEQDVACNDGMLCNGVERCDAVFGCQAGVPLDCDDGIGCTNDACSELAPGCVHVANHGACDDGAFCNGAEACVVGAGCVAGAPPVCDDGVACTIDACSDSQAACLFVPNHAQCNDGLYCNGVEQCSPIVGCYATAPVQCAGDGIDCTLEACDESADACKSTPTDAWCTPGTFCAPGQGCSVAKPCTTNTDCVDANACNGAEACVGASPGVPLSGTCAAGAPIDCDDGVACTTDACVPATGACTHAPKHADCNDGLGCNGAEWCDLTVGCTSGAAIDCNDGIACTADACVEPGTCAHVQNSAVCDDGNLCNGSETCGLSGCTSGTPLLCDDGIACTVDTCDPILGCESAPDDGLCACGETCEPSLGGCGNFCVVATCQGKVYACGDCVDNDGDCDIDSDDSQCLGACDNTEDSLYGGIPGQNNSPCKSDCYFDQDTGSGNDGCYWSHKCDPLSMPPSYPPEGSQCAYDPSVNVPGYGGTCAQAAASQSAECASYCGPLVPNGCDCFGCCAIPGAPTTVWLGSTVNGAGSCTLADVANPAKCKPCTQVPACLNACDPCEYCIGKATLPEGCDEQVCPPGAAACGQPNQPDCAPGEFCVTGCCQPVPQ
jgi:hypothetical protein